MSDLAKQPGPLKKAPENFLSDGQIEAVTAGRRDFLRKSFLAAGAAMAAPLAARAAEQGDPNILNLPEWSTTLGKPVATNPYGMPSKFESQLLRRESPGLARVGGARCLSARCKACSASSRRPACISSAITRAGRTSTRPSIA